MIQPHYDFDFVILCILDGWGIAPAGPGNAITSANLPNINRLKLSYPHTQLGASGDSVGLPRGEVGNTETGHLNLGAGKIIYQDLARINMAIADGSFFQNKVLLGALSHAKSNNSNLHIMGLLGAGGVHSNIEHLFALIQLANQQQFGNVYLHLFTDGRDSPPNAALTYVKQIEEVIVKQGRGQIASIMGRYWAMDRDLRWDRTQNAYEALVAGKGNLVKTPQEAIENSYSESKSDEFIEPSLIVNKDTSAPTTIKENDAVVFFNFRIDRPRQLTRAFIADNFDFFPRGEKIKNLYFTTMTQYSKDFYEFGVNVAFPPELVNFPLGRVISEQNFLQLRCAESEKERFVTFYFNGQNELAFPGEERLIVPSPKVATYDLKPEMSAYTLTDQLIEKVKAHSAYKFILINFANVDMVGHTGNLPAAVKACEAVDTCIGKLSSFALSHNGALVITADHGNAEEMLTSTRSINTEHSSNPVPLIIVGKPFLGRSSMLPSGILPDVAPTVLSLLNIPTPEAMMGRNLLSDLNI